MVMQGCALVWYRDGDDSDDALMISQTLCHKSSARRPDGPQGRDGESLIHHTQIIYNLQLELYNLRS